MKYVSFYSKGFFLTLILSVLTACSTTLPGDPASVNKEFEYISSVDIDTTMSQADLEATYGGKVVLYQPDAGFAVLGFTKEEGELTTLATEVNSNAFASPEVSASGYNAWAGGWSAWAGGWSAWAGGTSNTGPNLNDNAWNEIKLKEAHALSRNFGEGITVAVIDTGFDLTHPMLQGHLASSSTWKDYIDGDTYPAETGTGIAYGHGTAVAGVILQVAPKAKIMPLRVLEADGKGDLDDVILAINHAIDRGADIVNLSLGSVEWSTSLYSTLYRAKLNKVYVVSSAGNTGAGVSYPAGMSWYADVNPYALGVGSVDANGVLSTFSSYKGYLWTLAPGENIYSSAPGAQTARFTGTSFAAPLVSGALALGKGEVKDPTIALSSHIYSTSNLSVREKTLQVRGIDYFNFAINPLGMLDLEQFLRSLPGFTEPVYALVNARSNKCLDLQAGSTADGANIQQYSCVYNANQKWKLIPEGNLVKIQNVGSGKILSVYGAFTSDGANVDQWQDVNAVNQKWQLRGSGSSFEVIANHSGKCLTVNGGSYSDGANIDQWTCGGATNQLWTLKRLN